MKNTLFIFIAFIIANPIFSLSSLGQNAKSIVEKADKKRLGNTSQSSLSLTVIRPSWKREMGLDVWTKGDDFLLILINSPTRDKGTTFLKRGKEFWNWIPRIERNIKLPPSAMAQAWMGSDFSNDDLVKMSSMVDDYTHQLLGEEIVGGRDAYKIQLIPEEEAAVVWGKIITWVDKAEYLFLKTEYYDEDNELINTVFGKEIKTMGGRTVTSRLEIQPADKVDTKTVLVYHSLTFDEPLSDGFFSLQNMKRIR